MQTDDPGAGARGPIAFRLLLITDRRSVPARGRDEDASLVEAVLEAVSAVPPGSMAVMLREKDLSGERLLDLALALKEACRPHGAPLLINDRADVAAAAKAEGVHLPASGLPPRVARELLGEDALIGVSTHALAEVRRAAEGGADYVTFGPIFDTPSKRPYGAPVGLDALPEAGRVCDEEGRPLPIVGLGGITTPESARAVLREGATGVAFIRAVLASADPRRAAAELADAVMTR